MKTSFFIKRGTWLPEIEYDIVTDIDKRVKYNQ